MTGETKKQNLFGGFRRRRQARRERMLTMQEEYFRKNFENIRDPKSTRPNNGSFSAHWFLTVASLSPLVPRMGSWKRFFAPGFRMSATHYGGNI
jgi:hypothetical protein